MLGIKEWRHCHAGDALLHVAGGNDLFAATTGHIKYEGRRSPGSFLAATELTLRPERLDDMRIDFSHYCAGCPLESHAPGGYPGGSDLYL